MPAVISTAPWVSNAEAWPLVPRSFGSSASAPAATATQIGGFTKNTQRHPGPWASRPPKNTPAAAATPLMAPQAPNAVSRSLPSRKVVVSAERAAGAMSAPPTP